MAHDTSTRRAAHAQRSKGKEYPEILVPQPARGPSTDARWIGTTVVLGPHDRNPGCAGSRSRRRFATFDRAWFTSQSGPRLDSPGISSGALRAFTDGMNAPIAPTVSLENLARLPDVTPDAAAPSKAVVPAAASGLLGVVALAAWRLVPMVLAARRDRLRRAAVRRNLWIAGGVGIAALALGAWKVRGRADQVASGT